MKIKKNSKKLIEFPCYDKVLTPNYTKELIYKIFDSALLNDNIADKLNLLLHNQRVINKKLNTYLKKKNATSSKTRPSSK